MGKMFRTFGSLGAVALMLLGGCAASQPVKASASGKPHAECLVCKHENDLACVDVEVDAKTPHATIGGKEYFFCSDDCKKECVKSPGKYINQK